MPPRLNDVVDADDPASELDDVRPFDITRAAGPPVAPPDFFPPTFERGRRDDVMVYCERTGRHVVAKNVLFKSFARECNGSHERALSRVREAYWPIPHKQTIGTIMGHVEICHVLRGPAASDHHESEFDSNSDDDDDSETGDVVFELTNERVAVKVNYGRRMNQYIGKHAEDPLKEISAMHVLGNDNPHVMGMIDYLITGDDLNVVMPYAKSGDMFDMMQDRGGQGLSEREARHWFRQLIDGIQYMHKKGISHRDLSLENVMIDGTNLLIIDMGMAIRIPYTDPENPSEATDVSRGTEKRLIKPYGTCGKFPYMSPEIYENKDAFDGEAVDLWTAGVILFCLVTGQRCFNKPHRSDPQFWWVTNNLSQLLDDWGMALSQECVDLMRRLLQVDPRLRYTLDEVMNHPWFTHEDSVFLGVSGNEKGTILS